VEVLSEGNTGGETTRELRDYFLGGVGLVWFLGPRKRTVQVFTSPAETKTLPEDQTLDGGDVLPGFSLPVRQVFARVPRTPERPTKGKRTAAKKPGKSRKTDNGQ
jgi:Uma2 family endonuclease